MIESTHGLAMNSEPYKIPENRLWETVLIRAIQDALGRENAIHTIKARNWFRENGNNFKMVCDLADVDSDHIRNIMLAKFNH
ncbi:MAG: hypothetical protein H7832_13500 [Magnetococcus sp. DMHC-6]